MTQFLARRRAWHALLLVPLTAGPLVAQSPSPTPTDVVAACLDNAADAFVRCLIDLPWYAEALCHSRYAADGILCVPSTLLKFMMS